MYTTPSTNLQQQPGAFQPTATNLQPVSFLNPTPSQNYAPSSTAPPQMEAYDAFQQQGTLPTEPSKPPAAYDSSVPRGWNDPPAMSASRRVSEGEGLE